MADLGSRVGASAAELRTVNLRGLELSEKGSLERGEEKEKKKRGREWSGRDFGGRVEMVGSWERGSDIFSVRHGGSVGFKDR